MINYTTFDELLNSAKVHDRNSQIRITKMFKTKLAIALIIMNDTFQIWDSNCIT